MDGDLNLALVSASKFDFVLLKYPSTKMTQSVLEDERR